MKKVLITGIYGQDGSFLCEILAQKGYRIFGIAKEGLSSNSKKNKRELEEQNINLSVFHINLYDYMEVSRLIQQIQPDEVYHLAACHVSSEGKGNSGNFREQEAFNKNILATANILEACFCFSKNTKIVTAGSCLMYDSSNTFFQDESTVFQSRSLYGMAKITENMLVRFYREKGLYVCTAILYNHESHRRSSQFVTKKIVENMVMVKQGKIKSFMLGDLNAEKDWGYAGDYVEAMWRMLQSESPKDYIIATGETHTVSAFVEKCSEILKIDNWEKHIVVNDSIISRKISGKLVGNSEKIRKELSWNRSKNFEEIVEEMVRYELDESIR